MSLAFREMNERQSLHHSQSMAVCQNFLGLWLLKHGKSVLLTVPFKLSMKGKKTKIRKNDGISLSENENRQLDDLRQTDLAVYLKDFFFR